MPPYLQTVGIDVSAKTLQVCLQASPAEVVELEFDNTPEGHLQLSRRLTKKGRKARVGLEATGTYSLDLALALQATPGLEVMVINPRVARDFARARLARTKTDRVDARLLMQFVQCMEFQPWQPPAPQCLELRALARRITTLTWQCTEEKNRLHAATSDAVREDLREHIAYLEQRQESLLAQALELIRQHSDLLADWRRLCSIKGVGDKSSVQILAELCVLPSDMTARQWVAHAGLDPRHIESGTSVHRASRISRQGNSRLRAALYMPAWVAVQREPHVRAFYDQLVARGKTHMQAVTAVMRKLLHAFHGMLRSGTDFQGDKFRALEAAA